MQTHEPCDNVLPAEPFYNIESSSIATNVCYIKSHHDMLQQSLLAYHQSIQDYFNDIYSIQLMEINVFWHPVEGRR